MMQVISKLTKAEHVALNMYIDQVMRRWLEEEEG